MQTFSKVNNAKFRIPLSTIPTYDGGRTLVDRLVRLFGVKNRLELATLLGITSGTIATWQTRNSTPYELLIRIHLATGVPMEYLCFSSEDDIPDVMKFAKSKVPEYKDGSVTVAAENHLLPAVKIFAIENGVLAFESKFSVDNSFIKYFGISLENDFAVRDSGHIKFINSNEKVVTKGSYLFSVNNNYQIGELRQLPDGQTYFYDEGEKYQINEETTKIHGKVVSILESI
ncbi:CI repressor [Shewanella halifaxensis HAW-EB4]|uniref:CI repressor n=1 Tax=Shewanella halifaxensis (strain HAW-EB4) TaxID=458817 RepID=B0TKS2_SHEHH|nr:helix-turn-helix transcriptional regulator [Shewanella halifaxensis]ABZ75874.1 CI repressor [Shewanella halifaxensis HAW-EB4]